MLQYINIVHVVGTLQSGGVQKLVLGLAASKALSRHRHSVVCAFEARGELDDAFRTAGLNVRCCPFPWPDSLPIPSYRASRWIRHRLEVTFPARFASMLKKLKADLVHTHVSSRIDLQAAGVIRRARLPWVWTIHGFYRRDRVEDNRWRRAVAFANRGRCRITADSRPVAEDFLGRALGQRACVPVVHAGADVDRFVVPKTREPGWRARRGIPDDAVLFGSAGRLVHVKGHDVFLRAAHRMVLEGTDAHFVIAGIGPEQEALEREIARLALGQRFHLSGYESDVPSYLRQLDVFVLPSRSEGFPLALIEALASSLPCIATHVGGVPEMLGKEGGVIVEPDSPEALAEAMRRMLSPGVRSCYARLGPEIARRFSFDECAAQFDKIYDELTA